MLRTDDNDNQKRTSYPTLAGSSFSKAVARLHHQHHQFSLCSSHPPFSSTMVATQGPVVLPGDELDPSTFPSHPKKALQLGPGLRHILPSTILPTVAGQFMTDKKKNLMWIESNGGRVCLSWLWLIPLSFKILLTLSVSCLVCSLARRLCHWPGPPRRRRLLLRPADAAHLQRPAAGPGLRDGH